MLVLYFSILGVLAVYGLYRVKQVIEFWRYRKIVPEPKSHYSEDELPHITVQLPLFNEMYVVERLVKAITEIDYPRDRLEIQVLDDSTDETVKIGADTVAKYAAQGFAIHYIHRTDRTGQSRSPGEREYDAGASCWQSLTPTLCPSRIAYASSSTFSPIRWWAVRRCAGLISTANTTC